MKKLGVIIVGIGGWEEYTLPAIKSVEQWLPDSDLVVVDAASKIPYPESPFGYCLRLPESPSYAFAINVGVSFLGDCDWYFILNNDVLVEGPISLDALSDNTIYGRQIIEEGAHRWLGLWLAMVSLQTMWTIGLFDEKFSLCGFEDADYCIRAKEAGIETEFFDFPVRHFWGKTRWGLPDYKAVRLKNMEYFYSKHGFRLGGDGMKVIHD